MARTSDHHYAFDQGFEHIASWWDHLRANFCGSHIEDWYSFLATGDLVEVTTALGF